MGHAMRTLLLIVWLLLIQSSASALEGCRPDGSIRLFPDDVHDETYRLLQVCLFGHWSYVCSKMFSSSQDKNVVLNQLGCSSGDVKSFPSGNSTPVYVTNVLCRGIEGGLLECRHSSLSNITDCADRVGVQVNCTKFKAADLCQNGELMKNETNNILYICVTNRWSVLCPRLWTPAQTTVACRQLHPNKTVIRGNVTTVGKETGDRFFTTHYYCTGIERKLTDCHLSGIINSALGCPLASSKYAVGIMCETEDEAPPTPAPAKSCQIQSTKTITMISTVIVCSSDQQALQTTDVSPTANAAMSCSPLIVSWVGGGAIGVVLSAVILSTLFVIAFFFGRKTSQHKM